MVGFPLSAGAAGYALTDVPANSWARAYVEQGVNFDLIGGFLDRTFKPSATLTQAQSAVLLCRALALSCSTTAGSAWYAQSVASLQTASIIRPGDAAFSPEAPMPRGTFATWIGRALQAIGGVAPQGASATFKDVAATAQNSALYAAVASKIISGFPDGTFRPTATLTRAQVAKMIFSLAKADTVDPPTAAELQLVVDSFATAYAGLLSGSGSPSALYPYATAGAVTGPYGATFGASAFRSQYPYVTSVQVAAGPLTLVFAGHAIAQATVPATFTGSALGLQQSEQQLIKVDFLNVGGTWYISYFK